MTTRTLRDRLLDPSETALAWALLTPALLFIAVIVAYPVSTLVFNSFFDVRLSRGLPVSFIPIAAASTAQQHH